MSKEKIASSPDIAYLPSCLRTEPAILKLVLDSIVEKDLNLLLDASIVQRESERHNIVETVGGGLAEVTVLPLSANPRRLADISAEKGEMASKPVAQELK